MIFFAKPFEQLTPKELYEILRTRTEIFLLEQNIVCQDMDGIDERSLHCCLWEEERAVAYLRAFYEDDTQQTVILGRVVTLFHGRGDGRRLMEASLAAVFAHMPCRAISLHAQSYAKGFYERFGFRVASDEFMEEGIPHVLMRRQNRDSQKGESNVC